MVAGKPQLEGLNYWRDPLVLKMSATSRIPLPGDSNGFFLPRQLAGTVLRFNPGLTCGIPVDLRLGAERRESWSIELSDEMVLVRSDTLVVTGRGLEWSSRVWQDGATLRLERELRYIDEFVTTEEAEDIREKVREAIEQDTGYFELRRRVRDGD